ncbi:hypothetical protein BSL78_23568 [Apostichopus japonicus]|uniref:Reverse transcriptase RNase H-like domain-containing protein n=1 Tax=Stichopus japonicus TaxID=307972 RepID=A0A2G8JV31_STIJA|nr:hypothetical protein BSL78_23568 [Apostichopus japonicus]
MPKLIRGAAIIFGLQKFHLYFYGLKFTLVTDHKPLTRTFGPKSAIPPLAAARMQRWALILAGYQYEIVYRTSTQNANADLLSRLPLQDKLTQITDPDECYVFSTVVDQLPVTAETIAKATNKDIVLTKVYKYTLSGWPKHCEEEFKPYWTRRLELSLENGCILWGGRVIILQQCQQHILNELHDCHTGTSRMKSLARSLSGGQAANLFFPNRFAITEFSANQIACDVSINNDHRLEVRRHILSYTLTLD